MGGFYDQIAIGLTSIENYPLNDFAGYLPDSVGYHGDDGKCYVHGNNYTYGTKYGSKTVIGCGITKLGNIFFTHNSCLLPLLDVKMKGKIYSLISLRGKFCSVRIVHDINLFRFKHIKQFNYKNPIQHLSYCHSVTKLMTNYEDLLYNIQNLAKSYKNNSLIQKKFKKYALVMHKVCKNNKRHLLKYLIMVDDSSSSNRNTTDTNKYYENEDNFFKNQNIVEKVLKRPIFEPVSAGRFDKNKNMNKEKLIENENGNGNGNEKDNGHPIKSSQGPNTSNVLISSVHGQSYTNSFIRKQQNNRCNNSCGNKCLIF
jgi:hypothetical protein